MFNKKEFIYKVSEKAMEEANNFNCELLSVTFEKERKVHVLRVTLDGDDLSLDNCASISRRISGWLDEFESEIPFKDYTLEVTTPGADRPLRTYNDFKKCIDKVVHIETKTKAADGRKRYKGRVKSVTEDIIHIYIEEESTDFELSLGDISKARIEYEF